MRRLAVFFLLLISHLCLDAQVVITAEDRIEAVDEYCTHFMRPVFEVESSNCDVGDSVLLQIAVDTWDDGDIDYVYAHDVAHTRWATNYARSQAVGLPAGTQWISSLVLEDTSGYRALMPEDLGGLESSHNLYYTVIDQCGDTTRHKQVYHVADLTGPVANAVSLTSLLFHDPDGRGPIPASVELVASDYNVVSYDNCSARDELIYLLDGIFPVIDSTVEVGDSLIHVGLDVAHYFDVDGFVSLDIPSFDLCDSWDSVAYNSLIEYYKADIYRWDPADRTSSSLSIYDPEKGMHDISFVVADESLNVSDTAKVYVQSYHATPCPSPSGYTPYLGGFLGKAAALRDNCSVDILVDYDPTIFCEETIDTVVATLTIVDADRNNTLFYAGHEISPDFENWTTDAVLADELGFDSMVMFKHLSVLIEGQAPSQLTDLLSGLPVTSVVSFDLTYDLVSSLGHTAIHYQRHSVYDTIPPELVMRDVVIVDPDTNALFEIAATDVLLSSTDKCQSTDLLIYNFEDIQPLFIRRPNIECGLLSALDHLYRSEDNRYIIMYEGFPLPDDIIQAYRDGLWHRWSPATRSAYRYISFDQDCSPVSITVQARDSNGNQSSVSGVVQCSESTSTSDGVTLQGVHIYPNPATQRLFIDWGKGNSSKLLISLRSIEGSVILAESSVVMSHHQVLDISTLSPGLYILQVSTDKGIIHTEKIIIQ